MHPADGAETLIYAVISCQRVNRIVKNENNENTHYNVWDEITYPFLNFNGATVEV